MATLFDIRNATLAARTRKNDQSIGTQIEAGKVQVVQVTYPAGKRGKSTVTALSGWLYADDAVKFLDAL